MALFMCPNCSVGTQQITRVGVQIDMCPQCRGVWLDRGELEKILELERSDDHRPDDSRSDTRHARDHDRSRNHDDHHDHEKYGRKRRRHSLFDIFD